MGDTREQGIDGSLAAWIAAQPLFFVATAPSAGGHINCSPKGLDALRVIAPFHVAYADLYGSGIETVAHLRDDGRIVLMLCAFEGKPRICRLHGTGRMLGPEDAEWDERRALFAADVELRSIIDIALDRVSTSCGFGVPLMRYLGERSELTDWQQRKGPDGLRDYAARKNAKSIDGLPGTKPH